MTTVLSNARLQSAMALAARILLVVLFGVSGIRKIFEFPVFVAFISSKGLPFPEAGAVLAAILEIGATVLLLAGWKTRPTALILAIYTLVAGILFHDFWNMQSANLQGAQASNQMNHFLKNVSIAGGLLLLAALGPGSWSVDMRARKEADTRAHPQGT